jgi:tartrate dehydratase beta subunit/fumarate hydratase class I family protein
MKRNPLFTALSLVCALAAVSSYGQSRPVVGTVIDLDETRGRIEIETDEAEPMQMTIETDSISTVYYGFGTAIADKPEIFTGSAGLSNVRTGDRVEITGALDGSTWRARRVRLLGRDVAAAATGVGQTRPPMSATTPTTPATATVASAGRLEGTIRDVNDREGRLMVQTDDRRLVTVRTYRTTPVYYQGNTYGVGNLEIGDRVRVDADPRDAQADEISARRIDVLTAVQDAGPDAATGGRVTTLSGTVTRVEQALDFAYVDTGRGEVRLDMRRAEDARGEILRARDLRVGDRVEITGSYNTAGDLFLASTVRHSSGGSVDVLPNDPVRYAVVTMTGTVVETLEDGPTLSFRDRDTNQIVRIWVTPDFVVRTRGNTYTTAESLKVNDTAVVAAFRDAAGTFVAQSIRLRSR